MLNFKLWILYFQLIGIAVGSVSSWCLHRAVQAWKNPTLRTATTLLSQVNTFFGGTTGLYDLEVIYRIITACSAVALIGGFVQFLMSFWLLLAASQVSNACFDSVDKTWQNIFTHKEQMSHDDICHVLLLNGNPRIFNLARSIVNLASLV